MSRHAWPFSRMDVVSLISVHLSEPPKAALGTHADPITDIIRVEREDRSVDTRQMTLQSGTSVGIAPNWCVGAASLDIQRSVSDDHFRALADSASPEERHRYMSPMLRSRLHRETHRWHRAALESDRFATWADRVDLKQTITEPGILTLELLHFEQPVGPQNGILMIHARPDPGQPDPLAALRLLTLRSEPSRQWINHLLRGVGELTSGASRPYHLCLAQPNCPLVTQESATSDWSVDQQWLWLLSTLQDNRAYPVSEQNLKQLRNAYRRLSADWACTVMRSGTAFLASPMADDWEWNQTSRCYELAFLAETAPLLVRSLYADAIAFGLMKGMLLDDFAQKLAALEDPIARSHELVALESEFTRFRNTVWWQDTGLSGHATLLLRKFDACRNHKESFDRLVADFGDYSQKVERTELRIGNEISQATTALIGLVTCFGIPLGLLQVFGTKSTTVWVIVASYLAILGFIPAGDYIIGLNLPPRWRTARTPTRSTRIVWGIFWIALIGALLLAGIVPTK
jgi:hypothetical protein